MKNFFKRFWQEEEAMGTVEIVLIIAALVAVALVLSNALTGWVSGIVKDLFPTTLPGTSTTN